MLVLVCVAAITIPAASADQHIAKISNLANTTMPGCEEADICFDPSTIIVSVGAEVSWSNDDSVLHTITSGALRNGGPDGTFDSSLLDPGATFSHTFTEAGEYPYFCVLHPWMAGMVTVQDAPAQVTMTTGNYDPETITIEIGREVAWLNDDVLLHTVTSGSESGGPDGIFNSGPFSTGSTFTHTFTEAGEYPYFCALHPWLTGRVVVMSGAELPAAQLTLNTPATKVLEGDSVLISGMLASSADESAIAGQSVSIMESANTTLITLLTDDDGRFVWVLTGISQGAHEIYAAHEGSRGKAESARYSIVADSRDIPGEPSISLLTLDQMPEITNADIVFTGSLTSGGYAVPNRVVWIQGDDPTRTIGYGITDAQGDFTVTGAGLPETDLQIHAVFGGDAWYAGSQSPGQTAPLSNVS